MTNSVSKSCPNCGEPIPLPDGVKRGRPRRYCNALCRYRQRGWAATAQRWMALAGMYRALGTEGGASKAVLCEARAEQILKSAAT